MRVFHYHLVTSKVRQVEARYLGKLAFELVARHGRIGDELASVEAGLSWDDLDSRGFRLRLSELERGAINIVVQPGQWATPRVDHIGVALDDDEFEQALRRAQELDLRVQEHPGGRTFVATPAGYRLELHPPRDWLDALFEREDDLRLGELHLRADDPEQKAQALAQVLGLDHDGAAVEIGGTAVRFLPRGPQGRPELESELFL